MTQTSGSSEPSPDQAEDSQTVSVDTPPDGAGEENTSEPPDPERAFGRVAEDEALRRDLDDATFGPLLDLSANLAIALAGRFATTDDLSAALRAFISGAAEYARSGETAGLAEGLAALLAEDEASTVWFTLGNGASPEARAADLARSVSRAAGLEDTSQ